MSDLRQQTAPRSDGLHHLAEQHRYLYCVADEQVAIADYRMRGGALHITHTEVDPRWRGTGIEVRMVQAILDLLRAEGRFRVVPDCPFVAEFIERNPQYRQLTITGM